MIVVRVPRVELDIVAYEKCVGKFLAEVDAEVLALGEAA